MKRALDKFGKDSKFYLYLRLYQLAPLRDNFQLVVVDDINKAKSLKINYIVIPPTKEVNIRSKNKDMTMKVPGTLIFNTYKTSGRYDKLTYQLSPEVTAMVKSYMTQKKLKYNDYLFGKSLMSQFVGEKLLDIDIKISGQNINAIRHAVATEFYVGKPNPTAAERIEFAISMGHSPTMNILYIRKISEKQTID